MSEHDLDSLYKRASTHDTSRPSAAVRQAILEQARRLAEQAHQTPPPSRGSQSFARWSQRRWQIAVPLAAAALAAILWRPLLRSTLPAPATLQESAPRASLAKPSGGLPGAPVVINIPTPPSLQHSAPEPFPAAPQPAQNAAPAAPPAVALVPLAPAPAPSAADSANLARSSDVAASGSVAVAPRRQASRSPAPASGLQEFAVTASRAKVPVPNRLLPSDSLHQAAAQGDAARVRSLLQQNAVPIDARDASGRTALLLAVLERHEAVVRALLEQGADPNIGDASGLTPLAVARAQRQQPVIEALLQAGAR